MNNAIEFAQTELVYLAAAFPEAYARIPLDEVLRFMTGAPRAAMLGLRAAYTNPEVDLHSRLGYAAGNVVATGPEEQLEACQLLQESGDKKSRLRPNHLPKILARFRAGYLLREAEYSVRTIKSHIEQNANAVVPELDDMKREISKLAELALYTYATNEPYDALDLIQRGIDAALRQDYTPVQDPLWGVYRTLSEGYRKGTFVGIAARPNTGKTRVMLHMALCATRNPAMKLHFMGLESTREQLTDLLVSWKFMASESQRRNWTRQDYAMKQSRPLDVDRLRMYEHKQCATLANIDSIIRRVCLDTSLHHVFFVDYLQLVQVRAPSEFERINLVTNTLANLCKDLGCTIVAGIQINRSGDDRPSLSNLKGSGQIEQSLDECFIISQVSRNEITITRAKSRYDYVGLTVDVDVQFGRFIMEEK